MKLLITNTQEEQAYLILRSLRHEADRIVITLCEGHFVKRWSAIAAWSRHVHKRYVVPDCSADWRSGRIEPDNTPAEEAYIQRIEAICAAEKIDTVFPSYDAEVYVVAKNKARLARQGVLAVVPDYAALTRILDKHLTLQAAHKVGFPCPATRVVSSHEELLAAAAEIVRPWVLKHRCNAHCAEIRSAQDLPELERAFSELSAIQPRPLLQEYVPARTKRNFYLLVSPDLEVVSMFSPQVHRFRRVGMRTPCSVVETANEIPYSAEVRALVRELGIWGAMTLQTIVDDRDGIPRLMEINPRFGHNLWYRTELGINEPLMFLRLAQGRPVEPTPSFRDGVLLLDPLWDLLHLPVQCVIRVRHKLRHWSRGGRLQSRPYPPESIRRLARDFSSVYFSKRSRVTNPLSRGYLSDPLPPLVRTVRTLVEAIRRSAS